MLSQKIGLSAGFALAAEALLIPSTMSLPDDKAAAWGNWDVSRIAQSESRLVEVACPGCAFPVAGKEGVYAMDTENNLILDFAASADGHGLTVNGHQLYPVNPASPAVFAPQSLADVSHTVLRSSFEDVTTEPRPLDYALGANVVEAADGADAQLVDLDWNIFGLGGQTISVDSLSIRLLRNEDGFITLVDVVKVPKHGGAVSEAEDAEIEIKPVKPGYMGRPKTDCSGAGAFLCRWRQMVVEKINQGGSSMRRPRPCPGKKMSGHHGRPAGIPIKGGLPKFAPLRSGDKSDMMPHSDGRHGHHGHHGHHMFHRFAKGVRNVFIGFILPIMIGVAAGMAASVLGMVVGTVIAWVWIKFVRGGRRGNASQVQLDGVEPAADGEKQGLMEAAHEVDEEAPPMYSEAHDQEQQKQ